MKFKCPQDSRVQRMLPAKSHPEFLFRDDEEDTELWAPIEFQDLPECPCHFAPTLELKHLPECPYHSGPGMELDSGSEDSQFVRESCEIWALQKAKVAHGKLIKGPELYDLAPDKIQDSNLHWNLRSVELCYALNAMGWPLEISDLVVSYWELEIDSEGRSFMYQRRELGRQSSYLDEFTMMLNRIMTYGTLDHLTILLQSTRIFQHHPKCCWGALTPLLRKFPQSGPRSWRVKIDYFFNLMSRIEINFSRMVPQADLYFFLDLIFIDANPNPEALGYLIKHRGLNPGALSTEALLKLMISASEASNLDIFKLLLPYANAAKIFELPANRISCVHRTIDTFLFHHEEDPEFGEAREELIRALHLYRFQVQLWNLEDQAVAHMIHVYKSDYSHYMFIALLPYLVVANPEELGPGTLDLELLRTVILGNNDYLDDASRYLTHLEMIRILLRKYAVMTTQIHRQEILPLIFRDWSNWSSRIPILDSLIYFKLSTENLWRYLELLLVAALVNRRVRIINYLVERLTFGPINDLLEGIHFNYTNSQVQNCLAAHWCSWHSWRDS